MVIEHPHGAGKWKSDLKFESVLKRTMVSIVITVRAKLYRFSRYASFADDNWLNSKIPVRTLDHVFGRR